MPNVIAAAPQIMRTREFSPVPSGGNPPLPQDDIIEGTQSPLPYKVRKLVLCVGDVSVFKVIDLLDIF